MMPLVREVSVDAGRAAVSDFRDFFDAEYRRLARALYLLTDDVAEAEDVAQEAMVRMYERWERVRRMDSPTGYLYRTAMNLNRSRLRKLVTNARRAVGSLQRCLHGLLLHARGTEMMHQLEHWLEVVSVLGSRQQLGQLRVMVFAPILPHRVVHVRPV